MVPRTDPLRHESLQGELFSACHATPQVVPVTPDSVREKMLGILAQLRAAERMPWSDRKARINEVIFPQMANWLPEDEANQLRFEFAREMERLRMAA